jgi:hypothetical protein
VPTQGKRKTHNILLINQLVIDLYTCLIITTTYGVNLVDIYFSGTSGYLLCLLLSSEQLMWIGLNSSAISLVVITLERYVKIVHSVWHKNHFKQWMIYFGCAFSWASGFFGNFFSYLFGTVMFDGNCIAVILPNQIVQNILMWFTYLYYYQLPVLMFLICYARIFQVIRRQNRIFHQPLQDTEAAGSSSAALVAAVKHKSWRSEVNAAKTIILTTVFYTVSWMPSNFYAVIASNTSVTFILPVWYAAEFIALFNICANPFIYAVSYDDIRVNISMKLANTNLLKMFRRQALGDPSMTLSVSQRVQTATTTC